MTDDKRHLTRELPLNVLSGKKAWEPAPLHRPKITVTVDRDCYNKHCVVSMTLAEQMGQPTRWIEMSPNEARELGTHLIAIAHLSEQGPKEESEQELEHAFDDSAE
jgi:hypothetical protein